MTTPPHYLSVEEFVAATGLSESTVRRRIKDGSLPVCQPGGRKSRLLIPRDALARPVEPRAAAAPPPPTRPPGPDPPSLAGPRPGWVLRSAR
jgi:excisionase family DNA binding protein